MQGDKKGVEQTTQEVDDSTDDAVQDDTTTTEEDSTEDDSSTEDSTDGAEDDASDSEDDISQRYFQDPASVPKELRGAFKKMQGVFTRRMQDISLKERKANALDALLMDPDIRNVVEAKQRGESVAPSRKVSKNDDDEGDDDAPLTKKDLVAMFQQMTGKQRQEQQAQQFAREAQEFKQNNPDWQIYATDLEEVLTKHPTLSYQEAYDLITKPERTASKKKENLDSKKRAAKGSKPSTTGAREPAPDTNKRMSFQEAAQLALRQLRGGK